MYYYISTDIVFYKTFRTHLLCIAINKLEIRNHCNHMGPCTSVDNAVSSNIKVNCLHDMLG